MTLMKSVNAKSSEVKIRIISGRQDLNKDLVFDTVHMSFCEAIPGIVYFGYYADKEYEVLHYEWDGPRYENYMIQDQNSHTHTSGGRKGRQTGAIIGTILMPGLGTVIGAAVGTGKKEDSNTHGQATSHMETKEVWAPAKMKLRELTTDRIVNITFQCTSELDTKIRNNITVNLDAVDYIDVSPKAIPFEETARPENKDVLAQIRELKSLLDDGAITQEEYELLKKKII